LLSRFLKYINIAIALALAAFLVAAYWLVWRPLPQRSGEVPAPVASGATAARDSLGVPHITAASEEDALFVQGYVTAQDRLFQMDALRRLAAGELAEIVGPSAIPSDRESRALGMRGIAVRQSSALPAGQRAALAAYARGVNYFIETHRGRLPLEFTLLHYDPGPWTVTDSLLIGLQMYRTLTDTWKDDLRKRQMLAGGDAAKVNFLFPVRSGMEVLPGSNAWAVAGKLTASGRPILASDPHLEWGLPSIWYMVHLKAPGLDVTGVALPGVPGVTIGHNKRIAWGITNLGGDVADFYLEKLDPQTGRYLFRGKVEQARRERDVIRVKGGTPVEVLRWVTRHGPMYAAEGKLEMSLRWAAGDTAGFQFPLLEIDHAGNWREFTAALAVLPGPPLNFVYADVDGNIGYHVVGRMPIRRTYDGDVPVDGSSGDFEWDGYIPFEELPSAYNPPSGLLITANQNPFPENYAYRINGHFDPGYRAVQIRDRLSARKNWRAEEMLAVQKDVYSAFGSFLAKQVMGAYDRRPGGNAGLADAVAILRGWNGQMEIRKPAGLIVALTYQHLRQTVADRASPGKGLGYEFPMAQAALEKLLRTRPPGWFADYDQMLSGVFADAVEEGKRLQGGDVNRWDYGAYNQLTLANPVIGHLPVVGKYFNIGPVRLAGFSTTVKQTTRIQGPSMRMAVDFANLDGSFLNITLGQSGQILSSHYRDQWEAYYTGHSFPMQFGHVDAKDVLRFVPGGK
jgi:penicillin amidase